MFPILTDGKKFKPKEKKVKNINKGERLVSETMKNTTVADQSNKDATNRHVKNKNVAN